MRLRTHASGFTLIELLIASAILAVVAGISISTFSTFQQHMVRDAAVESIVSIFNTARTYALSSKNGTAYGIHIETDDVVLFSGTTYSAGAPSNQTINLEPGIEITSVSLTGGVQDVVFARQTGDASVSGTFTIYVASNPIGNVVVTVNKSGLLSYST